MVTDKHPALNRVREAKNQWDREVKEIDLRAQVARENLKAPVFAAIREALEYGVPLNRITKDGMDYAGIQSLGYFVGAKKANLESIRAAVESNAEYSGLAAAPTSKVGITGQTGSAHTFGAITWKLKESRVANHLNVFLDNANRGTWVVEMDKRDDGVWVVNETEFLEVEWANELQDVQAALSAAANGKVVFE